MAWWSAVFSEGPDGHPSFSRVATAVLVSFSMGWVTHIVWETHALPDFAGLALLIGTLYGLNQAKEVANKVMDQRGKTDKVEIVNTENNPVPVDNQEK